MVSVAQSGIGIIITGPDAVQHYDVTNNPGDPPVRIVVGPNPTDNHYTFAVIGGREYDCVWGYVVVGGHCWRSPCWQDATPGVLNLQTVNWTNDNSFTIDNRGAISFDGYQAWNVELGSARILGVRQPLRLSSS